MFKPNFYSCVKCSTSVTESLSVVSGCMCLSLRQQTTKTARAAIGPPKNAITRFTKTIGDTLRKVADEDQDDAMHDIYTADGKWHCVSGTTTENYEGSRGLRGYAVG